MNISLTEQTVICLSRIKFAAHMTKFVDEIAIAIYHSDLRMLMQIFYCRADRARFVAIIRIDPCQDLSAGASESLVDGIRLAFVFFAHPPGKFLLILFDNFNRSVC